MKAFNSLQDSKVKSLLEKLHSQAGKDWRVILKRLPMILFQWIKGKSIMESAKPYLKEAYIPIQPKQGEFLYSIARAQNAKHIVEFGTSFGISTIYLGSAVRDNGGGKVIGSEMEAGKIIQARQNIKSAGLESYVDIKEGDAMLTFADLEGPIDLLLLDGWKDLCLPLLKLVETKLRIGSIIVCDDMNSFKKTLKPYTDYVRNPGGDYQSMLLPLGEGLEFSVKIK